MNFSENLHLESKVTGPLPIINHFINHLGLYQILSEHLPPKPKQTLPYADAILLFVRNILIERHPLYQLSEWASRYDPKLIGLGANSTSILNDDRVGRSLDTLFKADRSTMLTEIVLQTISAFNVNLSQVHNDSTTVTVFGKYKKAGMYKGKPSVVLIQGHNKDHRPDLKQLLFCLTVSRDGAVPIHYKAYDGNTTDDTTHIQTWESIRKITGHSDFIYVADSKLCTRKQMTHITKEGGKLICVLPKTRKEIKLFKDWIQSHNPAWEELLRKPGYSESKGKFNVYWGIESPIASSEKDRIIWILSSEKKEQDEHTRQRRMRKTIAELAHLKDKTGKRRLKTEEQIRKAVIAIFKNYKSEGWFDWDLIVNEVELIKQKGRGRPGENTEYIRVIKQIWTFEASPNDTKIQSDAAYDGIFPLITNISSKDLPMKSVLLKYKYQPFIEKRHEQLKSVFEAMPVFLKLPHRIEALMFVYFIVLLINALIERELRLAMKRNEIQSLPLYPEKRKCKYPTTERIISLYANQSKHVLMDKDRMVKVFNDPLSEIQELVLSLLVIPVDYYLKYKMS